MGIVAADALAFLIGLPRRLAGAGVLISEGDMMMDKIADRLHPRPARRRFLEQLPGDVRKPVGLAIAAAQQIYQGIRGQVLDRMGTFQAVLVGDRISWRIALRN